MFTASEARDLQYHSNEHLTPKERVIDDIEDAIALAASYGNSLILFTRDEAESLNYSLDQIYFVFSSTLCTFFRNNGFEVSHPDTNTIQIEW